jgi:hypothetical protein
MSLRSFIGILGAIGVVAAGIALLTPLPLNAGTDQHGSTIKCGSPLAPDTDVAAAQDALTGREHTFYSGITATNYLEQCRSMASARKVWAIPVGIAGIVAVIGAAVVQINRPLASPPPGPTET